MWNCSGPRRRSARRQVARAFDQREMLRRMGVKDRALDVLAEWGLDALEAGEDLVA